MILRFGAFAAAALWLGASPLASSAQGPSPEPAPTPIVLPTLPPAATLDPYAKMAIDLLTGAIRQQLQHAADSASGRVTYFKRFDMQVQTGTNVYRDIRLHQGTTIDPRGASLAVGQRVTVRGIAQPDGSLAANAITLLQ